MSWPVTRAGWAVYYQRLHERTGRPTALAMSNWYAQLVLLFGERRTPPGARVRIGRP